jgi:hypothetical protein
MFRPHSKFTPQEDFRLLRLVEKHGSNCWRLIAKYMDNRNSRQCRERWLNYLNPALNMRPWTDAEDALLKQKYEQLGPRWVFMMRYFPNRTDGMIKNRFQVLQRKSRRLAAAPADREMMSPGENHDANEFELEFLSAMFGDREKPVIARSLFEEPDSFTEFGL